MDCTRYADILKSILREHAKLNPSHGKIETHAVFDDEHAIYCIIDTGWNQGGRIHGLIFAARIVDGQLILEHDGLHYGITDELIKAGIPEEAIVHAWKQPCPPEAKKRLPRRDKAPITN